MISESDCIIAHVLGHTGIHVRSHSVNVIEVICRIVPLEDVSSIDQDHVFLSDGSPYAVHGPLDSHQGLLHVTSDICRVEKSSVDIVGRQDLEGIDAILRAGAGGHEAASQNCCNSFYLHYLLFIVLSRSKITPSFCCQPQNPLPLKCATAPTRMSAGPAVRGFQ